MNSLNFRNQQIDFLRGIAILLVLFLHFHLAYHLDQSALNKIFNPHFINALFQNGNYGVTIFFVISGFLITSISSKRYHGLEKINVLHFYSFRFSRIIPCLLLAIGLILLLNLTPLTIFANKPHSTSLFLAIFSILTFWHNVLMAKVGYFNYCLNIYWSLSVEEIFYIAFPLACILFRKVRFLCAFWLILILIAPIYRSFHTNNEIISLYGYFSCFDAIAFGCCTALIVEKISFPKLIVSWGQYMAWILGITVYFYGDIMSNVIFGLTLIAICTSILLLAAAQTQKFYSDWHVINLIALLGKNSYELYLFHIFILAIMKQILIPSNLGAYTKLIWLIIFLISSAGISGLIAKYYSEPLNIKLRRMFSRTSGESCALMKFKCTEVT